MSGLNPIDARAQSLARRIVGDVIKTIHGNKLKRFKDGWSPLEGGHWDRWTVYSDREVAENFTLESEA